MFDDSCCPKIDGFGISYDITSPLDADVFVFPKKTSPLLLIPLYTTIPQDFSWEFAKNDSLSDRVLNCTCGRAVE